MGKTWKGGGGTVDVNGVLTNVALASAFASAQNSFRLHEMRTPSSSPFPSFGSGGNFLLVGANFANAPPSLPLYLSQSGGF